MAVSAPQAARAARAPRRSPRRTRWCSALLVPLLAVAPFAPPAPLRAQGVGAPERGFLWRLRRGAGTVYLAGSLHLLPPAAALPSPYQRAYAEAERLVLEIDPASLASPDAIGALMGDMMQRALLPPDRSLQALLGPSRWSQLLQAVVPLGLPPEGLDRVQPWLVNLLVMHQSLQGGDFRAESGVEGQLQRRAVADGKPIEALETAAQQLELFAGLPLADQVAMLQQTLTEAAAVPAQLVELEKAWRRGDEASLEALMIRSFPEGSTSRVRFLGQRNRAWLPAIEARLRRPDDTLVVVGALHLLGPDGLVALLRQRGLVLERVDAVPAAAAAGRP